MPGCEDAKLRDFGMTLGVRDTRKIDALYNMTGRDVREQARDGYGMLIIPTTGRYFHVPIAPSCSRESASVGCRPFHRW
jgi:hypothetical protein